MSTRIEWSTAKYLKLAGSPSLPSWETYPPNPSQWLNDPAFAGVFDVYDSAPRDFVNLNSAVLGRSRQGSLEPEAIVPFLKRP